MSEQSLEPGYGELVPEDRGHLGGGTVSGSDSLPPYDAIRPLLGRHEY